MSQNPINFAIQRNESYSKGNKSHFQSITDKFILFPVKNESNPQATFYLL